MNLINKIIRFLKLFGCLCEPLIILFYLCFGTPYNCDICEQRFYSKFDLKFHVQKYHPHIFSFGSSREFNSNLTNIFNKNTELSSIVYA